MENQNYNININKIHLLLHHVIFLRALSEQSITMAYMESW